MSGNWLFKMGKCKTLFWLNNTWLISDHVGTLWNLQQWRSKSIYKNEIDPMLR